MTKIELYLHFLSIRKLCGFCGCVSATFPTIGSPRYSGSKAKWHTRSTCGKDDHEAEDEGDDADDGASLVVKVECLTMFRR